MIQRFGCRPEHTTPRQQGADQHCAPIEEFETGLALRASKPEFADWADGQDQRDQKQQHHHPLPDPAEGITDHGFAVVGELLGQRQVDGRHQQKDQQGSSPHPEGGLAPPGALVRGGVRHRMRGEGSGADGGALVAPAGEIHRWLFATGEVCQGITD